MKQRSSLVSNTLFSTTIEHYQRLKMFNWNYRNSVQNYIRLWLFILWLYTLWTTDTYHFNWIEFKSVCLSTLTLPLSYQVCAAVLNEKRGGFLSWPPLLQEELKNGHLYLFMFLGPFPKLFLLSIKSQLLPL